MSREKRRRLQGLGVLTALLCLLAACSAGVSAQGTPGDPVEQLRRVLKAPTYDLAERDRAICDCLKDLRSLGEMRRAVALGEWRDQHPDPAVAGVDRAHRTALAGLFLKGVREVLKGEDAAAALVAVDLLAESGVPGHNGGDASCPVGQLAPDLVPLVKQGPLPLRAAAARALGQIDAGGALAVPVLTELLGGPEPVLRVAAVEGLGRLLQAVAPAAPGAGNYPEMRQSRRELARVAVLVLPAMGKGMGDEYVEVRRGCVPLVGLAAAALARMVSDPPDLDQLESAEKAAALQRGAEERADVLPLLLALRDLGPALAKTMADRDVPVRRSSQKALSELAHARWRWLRQNPTATPDDPLAGGLVPAVAALGESLGEPDARVRRSAMDVLEMLGELAAPAAPEVTKALRDPDRFVRWSAIRALGEIGARAGDGCLAELTRLLEDPDLDLRLAAAAALEKVAPRGTKTPVRVVSSNPEAPGKVLVPATLPALVRSLKAGDAGMRLAALRAIRGLEAAGAPAVPALREALKDSDRRVRIAAAQTLGGLGAAAQEAVDDLHEALQDKEADVRRAAGDALLSIVRPGSPREP